MIYVCALLQCITGQVEALYATRPSLVNEPKQLQWQVSMEDSLMEYPAVDKAGTLTPEDAVQQEPGHDVHCDSANKSDGSDAAIQAHYPGQVSGISAVT